MRIKLSIFLVTSIVMSAIFVDGQESSEPTAHAVSPLMQMKLEKSKAILAGLATENFEKIGSNARALKLLSVESGWNVIQTDEYAIQSNDFRRVCETIADAADKKDVHRATLGYVALTLRCVECHSYMRKHKEELLKVDLR